MAITNGLITLDEAKKSIFGNNASSQYDSDLEEYVEAVTPVIEDMTGPMVAREEVRTYSGGSEMVAMPWPFNTVVSVVEDEETVPSTDYTPLPELGLIYAGSRTAGYRAFTDGLANVTVRVTVGKDPIPANIKLGARELVRHMWTIGRQGPRPAFNAEQQELFTTPSGFLVPNRVAQLCRPNYGLGGFA